MNEAVTQNTYQCKSDILVHFTMECIEKYTIGQKFYFANIFK